MSRLSDTSLRFGRVLLGYLAAVFAASVAMILMGLQWESWRGQVSSFSEALATLFGALLLIAIFALPGFVLALLLARYVRFRSWASYASLGALIGALGLALIYAIPDPDGDCRPHRNLDAVCPPDFSPSFLLWLMLAGMLAGLVFRRLAIGSRS